MQSTQIVFINSEIKEIAATRCMVNLEATEMTAKISGIHVAEKAPWLVLGRVVQ